MTDKTSVTPSFFVSDRQQALTPVDAEPGRTLMQLLQPMGLVDGTCGGSMACGTCAVRIASPWSESLQPQGDDERMLLEGLGLDGEGCRLGCQIEYTDALSGMVLEVIQGHE